ncbi:hypothetical protein [Streptomyces poriticola]|uniref:hypothetical protein n=1 Tax=Streptomyces poriticola TaxID=3120506 RepID=UPI002FCE2C8E
MLERTRTAERYARACAAAVAAVAALMLAANAGPARATPAPPAQHTAGPAEPDGDLGGSISRGSGPCSGSGAGSG